MMLPSESANKQRELLASYPLEVQSQIGILTRKMLVLGFPAKFNKLIEGPIVRTFYFSPLGDGKFASVLTKADELAGTLSVESVRVERFLGEVAIAVPRSDRQLIRFDECLHKMLTSPETSSMALPLLMGQNTEGTHLYADLHSQPHMLISGATGSGKSIFTAQIICSLALFCAPDKLEMVLVDTKNLDLVLFKGLEHVKYVISSIEDLRAALMMLLSEVRLRNNQMSGVARNIREWNAISTRKMNYKVLIIDELADVIQQDESILSRYKKNERPEAIFLILCSKWHRSAEQQVCI